MVIVIDDRECVIEKCLLKVFLSSSNATYIYKYPANPLIYLYKHVLYQTYFHAHKISIQMPEKKILLQNLKKADNFKQEICVYLQYLRPDFARLDMAKIIRKH